MIKLVKFMYTSLFVGLFILLYYHSIYAQVVNKANLNTIVPDKDALVGSGGYRSPDSTYGTLGYLQIGYESYSGGIIHRSFMHFNLSEIPPGATIESATLKLWCSSRTNVPAVNMYKVTNSWSETSITWKDNLGFSTSSVYQIQTVNGWNSKDITDWVRDWYSNPNSNFGFIMKSFNETHESSSWFNSRENASYKPCLEVNYSGNYELEVNPQILDFVISETSKYINISSNTSWTVTDDRNWISTSPSSGTNNSTITVSVDRSQLSDGINIGTVTISGGGVIRTITVIASKYKSDTTFYDDFEDGSINTSKWAQLSGSGTVTESDGYLKLNYRSGTTPHYQIRTLSDLMQENVSITLRIKPVYIEGNKNFGFWLGDINTGSLTGFLGIFHSTGNYSFGIIKYRNYNGMDGGNISMTEQIVKTWANSSDFYSVHEVRIVKMGGTYTFYIDGEQIARDMDQSTQPASLYISLGRPWMENRYGEYGEIWLDEIYSSAVSGFPIASFTVSPDSGTTATTFTFNASGSTGATLTYRWDFDNNETWDYPTSGYSTSPTTTKQYSQAGTYTAKLEVKDTFGQTASITKIVKVYGLPIASFTVSPDSGTTATMFTFNASGSTGATLTYRWDFDNNETWDYPTSGYSTSPTTTKQYSQVETYTVKLEVKDVFNQVASTIKDNLRVKPINGTPPDTIWLVNSALYTYTMTMTAKLYIEGVASTDVNDLFGAFVGSECRGVAHPSYFPPTNSYIVLMTIYSNSSGETMTFKAWDNSVGKILNISETITFQPDANIGNALVPFELHTCDKITQSIMLNAGWTWFSLNVNPDTLTISYILKSLHPAQEDIIKNQTKFAIYYSGFGWYPSLDFNVKEAYMIKLTTAETLKVQGSPVNVEVTSINLNAGWTWISYLPQSGMSVTSALQSITPTHLDLIKNQTTFATYYSGLGWYPSNFIMQPGTGYKIKLNSESVLTYPSIGSMALQAKTGDMYKPVEITPPNWLVNPAPYLNTMTMTAKLYINSIATSDTNDIVGAFVGEECRGVAHPSYFPPTSSYVVLMTIHSNTSGETITFKAWDNSVGKILNISETITFQPDTNIGNALTPFNLVTNINNPGERLFGIPEEFSLIGNYPNPFNPSTTIRFQMPKAANVTLKIFDINGRLVRALVSQNMPAGYHNIVWDGTNDVGVKVGSGVYICLMQADGFTASRKMILIK